MTDTDVDFHEYDDDGAVMQETVITVGDREFVVVLNKALNTQVFERDAGATEPHTKWTEDGPEDVDMTGLLNQDND